VICGEEEREKKRRRGRKDAMKRECEGLIA
jgi:hypothetical protein